MGLERPATESLIRWYCREAGVRSLQKQVEKMYRKLAFKVVKEKPSESDAGWAITEDKLTEFLGKAPFSSDRLMKIGRLHKFEYLCRCSPQREETQSRCSKRL